MAVSLGNLDLARFFLAIIILLFSAHFFGYVFHRLKMPKVVGEIFGGILLGPTVLGFFLPEVFNRIFVGEKDLLAVVYWFGLILLMFCSGFEMNTGMNKKDKKTILAITIASTTIPFIIGWYSTSFFDLTKLIGVEDNLISLKIVVAIAIAITSIPVVSKIFLDLNIIKTRFARIVLGAATLHDIILWVFLAIASGMVSATVVSVSSISIHVIITLAFFVLAIVIMPILIRFVDGLNFNFIPKNYESGFVLSILLGFVVLGSFFDVNVVFGAFLAGIVVSFIKNPKFQKVKVHIKEFSFALFIPVYFAIVGMRLDLIHSFDFFFFIGFLCFALAVQGITVLLTTRLLKYSWLSSMNFAMAMNARGGPGIVLATVAFDIGIINESFFVTLIMLAIVTSLITGTWLNFVLRKKWKLLE